MERYIVVNLKEEYRMENNMAMEYPMFCYQCEQTAGGKGCTKMGVCGKTPEVANLQDLLIFQLKGISCYANELIKKGENVDKSIIAFIEDCLFTGDVLFQGSIGRMDLATGSVSSMKQSLKKLVQLDKDYKVYPGHGPSTSLSQEKKWNESLKYAEIY